MPEGPGNVEIAHQLHERGEKSRRGIEEHSRREVVLEIVEAFALAIVAIATAWSGYQAARWDGRSAERYAEASAYRVEEDEAATLGGQARLHDISTFNTWLLAKTQGNSGAVDLLERRFSDEYQIAFKAWLRTDPFNNPAAPPGPAFMPEYSNHREKEATKLGLQANKAFEEGRSSRETGEDYVRVTVFLATILFIIALSQRLMVRRVQLGLLGVAFLFIGITLYLLVIYPRA